MSNVPPEARKNIPRRSRSKLLPLFVAIALGVPAGFLSARIIHVPLVETLDTYRPNVITRLYSRDGKPFAEYAIQRRVVVSKKEMSPHLINAIIATEDANFYKHGGIDPRAIVRALIKDIIARKKVEGASTVTQQLARQVFLTPEKSWRRKINEAFLAVEIEKNFTKDQIFEMYANQVYLGDVYGVEAASRHYFGKHANELTIPEAAMIAGVIQRPGDLSPITQPQRALSRRNHVLGRMLDRKYITADEYRQALATPIVLGTYKEESPSIGAYFAENVRQYIEKGYGSSNLYQSGLVVQTTIDLTMQEAAEKALRNGLENFDRRRGYRKPQRNLIKEGLDPDEFEDKSWDALPVEGKMYPAVVREVRREAVLVRLGRDLIELPRESWQWTRRTSMEGVVEPGDVVMVRREPLEKGEGQRWMLRQVPQVQGAIVVLDVKSGEIRAMSGGYEFNTSKFNRAVQSLRQTGSVFKPMVYAAAFEKGFTPADTLFDSPIAIRVGNQVYSPRNYQGEYNGIITIQRALEQSINIPAVKTLTMVGIQNVIEFARRCGITAQLPPYPPLALGAGGVSPLQMTAAFNVFANNGVYVRPRYILRITDATQKVLEQTYPELSEATSAQVAYVTTHTMRGVVERGTAYAARRELKGEFAGKTGTTNGFTDAWFVGYSPELTVGVWVGYDDPSRSLGGGATGGVVALPVWIEFFKELDKRELRNPEATFEMPAGVVKVAMDLKTGRRGVGPCGRVVEGAFISGTEPNQDCSGASVAVSQLPFYLQRPYYQPKESEPVEPGDDATAKPGEGGEGRLSGEGDGQE